MDRLQISYSRVKSLWHISSNYINLKQLLYSSILVVRVWFCGSEFDVWDFWYGTDAV